jgi:ABC-type molybdate transport system substrate-binding protein
MRSITLSFALAAAVGSVAGPCRAEGNWMEKMQGWWSQTAEQAGETARQAYDKAQATYQESWAVLPGEIKVCVAKELEDWIQQEVTPRFKQKAPRISVKIEAHGSGELADAMNAGNSMKCDLWIPGSDVAALRWKAFPIGKRKPVAYSATVWVGDKEKLDAARSFLGKAPGSQLGCNDLAKVAAEGRYGKIKEGGKGKVELEMTTSNSGQTMYVSCVYSMVDALDPAEVEAKLNANPALEEEVRAFFKQVKFDVDSTTSLTVKPEGEFMHPNGIAYKHLVIATYESFLPQLTQEFAKQGKTLETIYPAISILNNFPAVRVTTEGKNGNATQAFLDFLLGAEAQAQLPRFGFRPANPKVDYSKDPIARFFNNNIEVGDSPSSPQMLRDLWGIVSAEPKAQAVKF